MSSEGIKKCGEICVTFVNDDRIKELNKKFCGKDNTTDVLAFDMTEAENANRLDADIIISADTALRNAKVYKNSAACEMNLYVIHGVLHLIGFNDHTQEQRKLMRSKEKEYADTKN